MVLWLEWMKELLEDVVPDVATGPGVVVGGVGVGDDEFDMVGEAVGEVLGNNKLDKILHSYLLLEAHLNFMSVLGNIRPVDDRSLGSIDLESLSRSRSRSISHFFLEERFVV